MINRKESIELSDFDTQSSEEIASILSSLDSDETVRIINERIDALTSGPIDQQKLAHVLLVMRKLNVGTAVAQERLADQSSNHFRNAMHTLFSGRVFTAKGRQRILDSFSASSQKSSQAKQKGAAKEGLSQVNGDAIDLQLLNDAASQNAEVATLMQLTASANTLHLAATDYAHALNTLLQVNDQRVTQPLENAAMAGTATASPLVAGAATQAGDEKENELEAARRLVESTHATFTACGMQYIEDRTQLEDQFSGTVTNGKPIRFQCNDTSLFQRPVPTSIEDIEHEQEVIAGLIGQQNTGLNREAVNLNKAYRSLTGTLRDNVIETYGSAA